MPLIAQYQYAFGPRQKRKAVVTYDNDSSLDRHWLVLFPIDVVDGHGGTMAYRATKDDALELARWAEQKRADMTHQQKRNKT